MKKKNKIVKIIAILVLIILVIGTGLYIKRRNNYIYITQFSPTTSRQICNKNFKWKNCCNRWWVTRRCTATRKIHYR